MSIASYVANLKEKPEHVRRRVALYYSGGFTLVILAFWISSFTSIGIGGPIGSQKSAVAVAEKVVSPGSSLIAGVGSFANDLWGMLVKPKTVKYSEIEVLPGKK
jgi:hypothetical protein